MRYTLISVCAVMSLVGCGPSVVDEAPRCLSVTEPEGGAGLITSLPARVSLLFRVDTCAGEPVPGLDASAFVLSEDGRTVSTFESQQRVRPKGEQYRLSSLVVLDLSGSMLRSGEFPQLKAAAAKYVQSVLASADGQRVGLMTFDGREKPQLLVDFTSNAGALLAGLESLSVPECRVSADCAGFVDRRTCAGWRCVDDSTNLNGAIVNALDVLDAQLAATDVAWRDGALVLFTDGTDQASRVSPAAAMERARATSSHLFTVGLGGEVDEGALRAYGRDGYWPVERADKLEDAFAQVAARVNGLANRFYLLEYCSPKRGGTHTLKVTVRSTARDGSTLVGGYSGQFDASGFASGCEL